MEERHLSALRRGLLWWFGGNPYVSVNFAVDFLPARDWLAGLPEPRPSIHHLVAGAVARTLRAFPDANARVLGNRIVRYDRVGIAMPVNLLGHAGESRRELGMAIVPAADRLSLLEIAESTRRTVKGERTGTAQNDVLRTLERVVERLPQPLVNRSLGLVDRATRRPAVAARVFEHVPITTALSNAGAAFAPGSGIFFRGADVSLPTRLVELGTFWGTSVLQDEVIPVGGVPTVRPMLPVLFMFDHRLIDGVMAARLLLHFGAILRAPWEAFGADGSRQAD
jgi:pyruvate/2-oxoglutarate dehydrogenase complex dihydrolipoamide acyltransferase (E2) component